MAQTKIGDLINPQVMGDMVSAKLPKKIKFAPIARIDDTLVGQPGNTITLPKYGYIGDAEDLVEGAPIPTTKLSTTSTTATVKKAGKGAEITDEAVLSGYGDPFGEAASQIAKSIGAKVDNDCYDELTKATQAYDGTAGVISYAGVVGANAVFGDESDSSLAKVIFINPAQEQTLLLDSNFTSNDKYPASVIMNGYVGRIAGAEVVKSKKVKLVKYVKDNSTGTITIVSDDTTEESTKKHLSTIMANAIDFTLAVGDKVSAVSTEYYANPVVIVDVRDANEAANADYVAEEIPALSIFLKRNVLIETDRNIGVSTEVVGTEHYVAKLTNDSKVVLAKFAATSGE